MAADVDAVTDNVAGLQASKAEVRWGGRLSMIPAPGELQALGVDLGANAVDLKARA
jgi:hypothetical protein